MSPPGEVLELVAPATLTASARPVWEQVVPWLCERGVLVPADLPLLVELVEALGLARRYGRALEVLVAHPYVALGFDEDDEDDDRERLPAVCGADVLEALVLASPRVKRLRSGYVEALTRATSLASCFGLTPTDRMRLGMTSGRDGGKSLAEIVAAGIKAMEAVEV